MGTLGSKMLIKTSQWRLLPVAPRARALPVKPYIRHLCDTEPQWVCQMEQELLTMLFSVWYLVGL